MFYDYKSITDKFLRILASTYGISDDYGDDLIERISDEHHRWKVRNVKPIEDDEKHPYDEFVIKKKSMSNLSHEETLERWKDPEKRKSENNKRPQKATKLINYDYITDYCIKKFAVIVSSSDTKQEIYIFDRGAGKYRVNNGDIEGTITEGLKHNRISVSKKISAEIHEVMSRIKTRNVIPREQGLPFNFMKHAIPLRNGVYDIDTKRSYRLSPAYGFSYILDVDYYDDIDTSLVENYLKGLVDPEHYSLLLQMVASILLGESYKRFYVLYNASGNNGKTTFQKFVTYMVGETNVANLSIDALTNQRFMTAELYGKVANIAGDIPQRTIYDTSVLKQIVGDDRITAERKGKDPFTFTNKSVNIFSANNPPIINDPTDAFWSRVIIVKFPNMFAVDPNFGTHLFTEENKTALLKLAVDYIPILLEKGPIQFDVTETEREYRKVSDSVYAFVDECLELYDEYVFNDPEAYDRLSILRAEEEGKPLLRIPEIELEMIHRSYRNYCSQKAMKALGKTKFERALENNSLIPISVKRKGSSGDQIAIVIGARLNQSGLFMEEYHLSKKDDTQARLAIETT